MRASGALFVCYKDRQRCSQRRRVHDALLTRLSNDDDMEKSLSTFASEMASSAMILGRHLGICMAGADSVV